MNPTEHFIKKWYKHFHGPYRMKYLLAAGGVIPNITIRDVNVERANYEEIEGTKEDKVLSTYHISVEFEGKEFNLSMLEHCFATTWYHIHVVFMVNGKQVGINSSEGQSIEDGFGISKKEAKELINILTMDFKIEDLLYKIYQEDFEQYVWLT